MLPIVPILGVLDVGGKKNNQNSAPKARDLRTVKLVSDYQRAVTVDIYLASRSLDLSIALWDITSVYCESASGPIAHLNETYRRRKYECMHKKPCFAVAMI